MDNPKSPQPLELEIEPTGEANTTVSTTQPINDAVEPPQTEAVEPATAVPAPEIPKTEPLSEPIPETPTAQMGRNEPLPESTPEAETPTNTTESGSMDSGLGSGMTTPSPQTQQGTVQPEPTPTQESPTSPILAQAPVVATPSQNIIGLILTKARLVIQFHKQKKLNKIMGLFLTKSKITNDEVEKLLHVSDATATRYLSELEKQGRIKQSRKTGKAVNYVKL